MNAKDVARAIKVFNIDAEKANPSRVWPDDALTTTTKTLIVSSPPPKVPVMPKTTLIFALLLIALGVGAFAVSSSRTALLPAYVGVALGLFAGLALAFEGARKHLMHVAAAVALLGVLAPAAALVIRATEMSPLALGVNLGMLLLSAALLVLMVRSFIATRRARSAAPQSS